jgi:hypothetical protein
MLHPYIYRINKICALSIFIVYDTETVAISAEEETHGRVSVCLLSVCVLSALSLHLGPCVIFVFRKIK